MKQATISAIDSLQDLLRKRSAEDLKTIAHIKRFLELASGDRKFRDSIKNNPRKADDIARSRGLSIELKKFSCKFNTETESDDKDPELPLALLWSEWIKDILKFRSQLTKDGFSKVADARFNAWRRRQIERTNSEMGMARGDAITHPVFSFELSKGCSVGCWFCGLGAKPFKGHFQRNPRNVSLWKNVLQTAADLFGSAAQTSFCYWATEPFDNPNYLDFIQDYKDVVGVLPQTTSAVPTRDLVWTRRLMNMVNSGNALTSRFSIINSRVLGELHRLFSPEELLRYELLMQLKESSYGKARAGKTFKKENPPEKKDAGLQVAPAPSSIACVSGYLVNMMDRSIKLVTPCHASDKWPLGFRVHDQGRFNDAREFGDFITGSISKHMPADIPLDAPISFRKDLKYERVENGFTLSNNCSVHSMKGNPFVSQLGDLVASGDQSVNEIIGILIEKGDDIFAVKANLNDLYEKGLLEDMES